MSELANKMRKVSKVKTKNRFSQFTSNWIYRGDQKKIRKVSSKINNSEWGRTLAAKREAMKRRLNRVLEHDFAYEQ